ncbi:hypothetical protein PtA15_9A604 [Puccinia triticina]|uniref:Uncharacterized protein n=1 Tax=Puccinia triticina TaxID=208348 RepID=A0ABY7CVK8_9BASI|nr:uncharacterized protein PtA15_9A604 [Puccinia triticina]WAQ88477.1 hypothetical protein PtA15_9A604 [Puccinia triticina]
MANRSTTNHQATDDFFTLTRRVGAKRDPPDYTPNGTAEDAPQESQLGPSQAPEGQSCRLFYEDSNGEDLASPSIEASNSANQNPPGPPDGGNPNATAANAPARLGRHRQDGPTGNSISPARSANPSPCGRASGPAVGDARPNPSRSPDGSTASPLASRGPIPHPAAAARVFLPARGPLAPGGRVFSAPRITSMGRVIPPRLVSNPSPTAAASVPVQATETATALGPSPNQSDSPTPANGARHVPPKATSNPQLDRQWPLAWAPHQAQGRNSPLHRSPSTLRNLPHNPWAPPRKSEDQPQDRLSKPGS